MNRLINNYENARQELMTVFNTKYGQRLKNCKKNSDVVALKEEVMKNYDLKSLPDIIEDEFMLKIVFMG